MWIIAFRRQRFRDDLEKKVFSLYSCGYDAIKFPSRTCITWNVLPTCFTYRRRLSDSGNRFLFPLRSMTIGGSFPFLSGFSTEKRDAVVWRKNSFIPSGGDENSLLDLLSSSFTGWRIGSSSNFHKRISHPFGTPKKRSKKSCFYTFFFFLSSFYIKNIISCVCDVTAQKNAGVSSPRRDEGYRQR